MAGDTTFRAIQPQDAAAVYALASAEPEFTAYSESAVAALGGAFGQNSMEALAMVAEQHGAIVAVVVYGLVAGSEGAGKLHFLAVTRASRRGGVAASLVKIAADALERLGARLIVAEVPDDPAFAPGRALLQRSGFHEESRIADFYRDGMDLALWRRDLDEAGAH